MFRNPQWMTRLWLATAILTAVATAAQGQPSRVPSVDRSLQQAQLRSAA